MSNPTRKQEEIAHYDKLSKKWLAHVGEKNWHTDAHHIAHEEYSSYRVVEKLLEQYAPGKTVLDYGCGTGIHSLYPLLVGAKKVIGIDLSQESLRIAAEKTDRAGMSEHVRFIPMDCEHLDFPDNTFNVILDGGTFSSLDLDKALPELARVLKPDGVLIGIETLGHNPVFNLKRALNVKRGIRTKWAADHIFTVKDFTHARQFFESIQARYFHLLTIFLQPLRRIPGIPQLIAIVDRIDSLILSFPLMSRYAFKTVFVFKKPRKHTNK